jgi:hypothetical protein
MYGAVGWCGGHASSITLLRHFYTDDEFAHAQNLAPSNSIEICGLHAEFGAKGVTERSLEFSASNPQRFISLCAI